MKKITSELECNFKIPSCVLKRLASCVRSGLYAVPLIISINNANAAVAIIDAVPIFDGAGQVAGRVVAQQFVPALIETVGAVMRNPIVRNGMLMGLAATFAANANAQKTEECLEIGQCNKKTTWTDWAWKSTMDVVTKTENQRAAAQFVLKPIAEVVAKWTGITTPEYARSTADWAIDSFFKTSSPSSPSPSSSLSLYTKTCIDAWGEQRVRRFIDEVKSQSVRRHGDSKYISWDDSFSQIRDTGNKNLVDLVLSNIEDMFHKNEKAKGVEDAKILLNASPRDNGTPPTFRY